MKTLKILFWIAGVLIFLAGGAVLVVTNLVDPNDYKPKIQQIVETQTGRQLKLIGDLELTFYPWVGINTGRVELSNPGGFGEQPMLSVEQADIRIKLLPLLKNEIEVGDVVLNQPMVQLITLGDGSTNWDDLMTIVDSSAADQGSREAAVVAGLVVQGVSLVDGEIIWNDQNSNQQLTLSKLNLSTSQIQPGVPLDIDLSMYVAGSLVPETVSVQLSTTTNINGELSIASLEDTLFSVKMGEKTYNLDMPNLVLELEQQSVSIPEYVLTMGDLNLDGELNVTGFLTSPTVSGQLNLSAPDFEKMLFDAGIEFESGQNRIGKINMASGFSFLNNTVEVNSLVAEINVNGQPTMLNAPFASLELLSGIFSLQGLIVQQGDMEIRTSLKGDAPLTEPGKLNIEGSLTLKTDPGKVFEQNGITFDLGDHEIGESALDTKFTYSPEKMEVSDLVADALINGQKTSVNLPYASLGFSDDRFSLKSLKVHQNELQFIGNVDGGGLFQSENLNLGGSVKLKIEPARVFEQNRMEIDMGGHEVGETTLASIFSYSHNKVEISELITDALINGQKTNIAVPAATLDLLAQKLSLPEITIRQSGVDIKADLVGEALFSDPEKIALNGSAKLVISDLPGFLQNILMGEILPVGLIARLRSDLDIQVNDGDLQLSSMETSADDMELAGEIAITNLFSGSEPDISIIHEIKNIDIGKTLTVLEVTEDLEGTGFLQLDLTGISPEAEQPMGNMDGQIDFNLKNGAIKGFDLQATLIQLDNALNVAKGKQESDYQPDVQTRFSELSGKFNSDNGRLQTDNLAMKAPGLRVNGNGVIDLPRETVDLRFDVSIVKTVEGQGGAALADLQGVNIPMTVTGNLAAPGYGLDVGGLLKQEAKKEIKKEVEKEISKQLLKIFGD